MLRKLVLVVLMGAFAFGMVAMAQEPVTVEFWHAMSSRYATIMQTLIDEFQAEYPYITINAIYQGGYGDLQSKIQAAVVAGNLPTMAQVYENYVTPIPSLLYPIGSQMTDEEKADIIDGLVPSNTFNGVLTTVPFNKSIMVLYYDKTLIPNPPTTWQEFFDVAKAQTVDLDGDGVIDRYGTGFRPSANPELFLNLLQQAGGSILNADWTECTIDNAAGQTAMAYAESLAPYSYITSEYMSDHFPSDVAMFVDTSAGYYYNNLACTNAGDEMGVARVPMGPVNQESMIQGTNLAVFDSGNQTQAQQEAAALFCRFLLRPENTAYWAMQSGYQPVVKSAYDTQEWIDFVATHDYQVAMSEQMLDGFSQLLHPNYGDMRNAIGTAFEEVMTGVTSAADALSNIKAEIEMLLN
jgi:multiple sugar transport system substrate-binding protein